MEAAGPRLKARFTTARPSIFRWRVRTNQTSVAISNATYELRGRENYSKVDHDEKWFGYVYPKDLDKQTASKLIVAGTAPELRVYFDKSGSLAANGKRIYTVSASSETQHWYLLAVLNSKACDFVFRRIARPKVGGFFDIEKQFIAPLPIPDATDDQKANVAAQATTLQELTTNRQELANRIAKRTDSLKQKKRPVHWLFPDLPSLDDLENAAPQGSDTRERKSWAKAKLDEALTAKHGEVTGRLNPTAT